jgi:hypothetical protein
MNMAHRNWQMQGLESTAVNDWEILGRETELMRQLESMGLPHNYYVSDNNGWRNFWKLVNPPKPQGQEETQKQGVHRPEIMPPIPVPGPQCPNVIPAQPPKEESAHRKQYYADVHQMQLSLKKIAECMEQFMNTDRGGDGSQDDSDLPTGPEGGSEGSYSDGQGVIYLIRSGY